MTNKSDKKKKKIISEVSYRPEDAKEIQETIYI